MTRPFLLFASGAAVVLVAAGLALFWRQTSRAPRPADTATYVGARACEPCHRDAFALWKDSHHALAMQTADSSSVLGDFGDATFTAHGVTSTFRRERGRYTVTTDGPDGALRTYPVEYVFGVAPLQQVLIAFPGGRLQALSVAWDSRPKAEGGQRWFHLYPNERIDHRDLLHWTGPLQSWNTMCADCHSTDLRKNYNAGERRYEPAWTDISVACEACHGPGSRHVAWAEAWGRGRRDADPLRGFAYTLADSAGAGWVLEPGQRVARRAAPRRSQVELETCAPCHSRRSPLTGVTQPGALLEDHFRLALLDDSLYHADGQIRDEVYEYGSFLQSRMHQAGVTCSDCHEPHGARLRREGNALCGGCHQPAAYDGPQHHFHPASTPAAQCVSCHMPEQHYMVVDGRRDHSLRVPRPDLSGTLGTPNACNQCHADRSPSWAASAVERWYGPGRRQGWHWGEALRAARDWQPDAEAQLVRTLGDASVPAIARATANGLLAAHLSPGSLPALEASLRDSDPLVRRTAVSALAGVAPARRVSLAAPLLSDPVRSVRAEALTSLLDAPRTELTSVEREAFDRVVEESRRAEAALADRPESHLRRGVREASLGRLDAAEAAYRDAIHLQPRFVPAYVNLADLHRQQGQEARCVEVLEQAIALDSTAADAFEALGLALVRQQRLRDALAPLEKAARLRAEVPRYTYVLAVALHQAGERRRAIRELEAGHRRQPAYRDYILALVDFHRDAGETAAAEAWSRKLARLSPPR